MFYVKAHTRSPQQGQFGETVFLQEPRPFRAWLSHIKQPAAREWPRSKGPQRLHGRTFSGFRIELRRVCTFQLHHELQGEGCPFVLDGLYLCLVPQALSHLHGSNHLLGLWHWIVKGMTMVFNNCFQNQFRGYVVIAVSVELDFCSFSVNATIDPIMLWRSVTLIRLMDPCACFPIPVLSPNPQHDHDDPDQSSKL